MIEEKAVSEKMVVIAGNSYKINFPTVGQLIDIKVKEMQYSKGYIRELLLTELPDEMTVLLSLKVLAATEVLIPDLVKDLKVDRLRDLRFDDFTEVMKVVGGEVLPWIYEWQKKIQETK